MSLRYFLPFAVGFGVLSAACHAETEPAPTGAEPEVVGTSEAALVPYAQQCPYWWGEWGMYTPFGGGASHYAGPPIDPAACNGWCQQSCGEPFGTVYDTNSYDMPSLSICICGAH